VENTGLYKSMAEHGLLPVVLYGVSSACIIIGLVAAETAGNLRVGRIGGLQYCKIGPLVTMPPIRRATQKISGA